jgi:hypothetical protein
MKNSSPAPSRGGNIGFYLSLVGGAIVLFFGAQYASNPVGILESLEEQGTDISDMTEESIRSMGIIGAVCGIATLGGGLLAHYKADKLKMGGIMAIAGSAIALLFTMNILAIVGIVGGGLILARK